MVLEPAHVRARALGVRGRLLARREDPRGEEGRVRAPGREAHLHVVPDEGRRRRAQGRAGRQHARSTATTIVYKKDINLGIAVALDWGLIVPVIKHAEEKNLLGLSRAIAGPRRARAVEAAQAGRGAGRHVHDHQPRRVRRAVRHADHQPAAGRHPGRRPRSRSASAVVDDAIAIRTKGYLSLGYDHRLIDGAVADQFMSHLKQTHRELRPGRGVRPGASLRSSRTLVVRRLGVVSYAEGLELQQALVAQRAAGEIDDVLLLLQHPARADARREGRREPAARAGHAGAAGRTGRRGSRNRPRRRRDLPRARARSSAIPSSA